MTDDCLCLVNQVQLNATGIHAKRSKLEKLMNKEMLILALIGLALCVIGTIGADLWIRAKHVCFTER